MEKDGGKGWEAPQMLTVEKEGWGKGVGSPTDSRYCPHTVGLHVNPARCAHTAHTVHGCSLLPLPLSLLLGHNYAKRAISDLLSLMDYSPINLLQL